MKRPVVVQFWGTRGSLAKPGKNTVRYGGNTSCVQVTSPGGSVVVIDCGTGAHDLGQALVASAKGPPRGTILISHTHWDHIQGFPFFEPLFNPGGDWNVYGPAGLGESLRDTLAGQMHHAYFPVKLDDLGASIRYHDLLEGTFEIDDIRITTRYLNHPALTLGYRLEMDGICVVYACDHEPYSRDPGRDEMLNVLDQRHSEFLEDADLVIHDAQYTDAEYAGKKGWGHGTVEYVSELGQLAGVKRMAFTHHDPARTDDELDRIVETVRADLRAKQSSMEVFAAADGQIVELHTSGAGSGNAPHVEPAAVIESTRAIRDSSVLMGIPDPRLRSILTEAVSSDSVHAIQASDEAAILEMAKSSSPSLILMEDLPPAMDGLGVCRSLRADGGRRLKEVPVIIVTDREKSSEATNAGVTGWLIKPFTAQFARAQIQARILRAAFRWVRAPLPPDEERRLAALRELGILDTPPEERFDRITRIAAALADVPIAYVSLMYRDRQWFKSCHGFSVTETPRDEAFCAHVVHSRKPMIVSDTHQDDRFADNPLVTGAPHIRFYAGFPIFHADGSCVGTLCLADNRPRQFPEATIRLFEDLARLVQQELNTPPQRHDRLADSAA
jgi:phosphoribosyl 1,2-cyclic phosphodiesterase/FixJ family two-component response regulator